MYVKHEVTLKGLWDEKNSTLEKKVLIFFYELIMEALPTFSCQNSLPLLLLPLSSECLILFQVTYRTVHSMTIQNPKSQITSALFMSFLHTFISILSHYTPATPSRLFGASLCSSFAYITKLILLLPRLHNHLIFTELVGWVQNIFMVSSLRKKKN